MRAHKVYEFKRSRGVKTSLGLGKRKQIQVWFETFAPDADYTIDDDLSVHVEGNLDLRNTSVTYLPDGLRVGRSLDLNKTPITHLPDGLRVGGYLDLSGTPITHLPQELRVGGNLFLNHTPVTHLPDGLHVGKSLFLERGGLAQMSNEEIRSRAEIRGTIYI